MDVGCSNSEQHGQRPLDSLTAQSMVIRVMAAKLDHFYTFPYQLPT